MSGRIDRLSPAHQLTLKVASVIGPSFALDILDAIHPLARDRAMLSVQLHDLAEAGLLRVPDRSGTDEVGYAFCDEATRDVAYSLLLFAHRRQLHRDVAVWYERRHADDLGPVAATIAKHWDRADEPAKALYFLELAGAHARQRGAHDEAARFLHDALALEAHAAVMSADYGADDEPDDSSRS